MVNKFCIDIEVCEKNEVSLPLALYLVALYFKQPIANLELLQMASKKGLIVYYEYNNGNPKKLELSEAGIHLVETLFLDSEYKEGTKEGDRFSILAKKLQELYPSGRKQCGNTSYPWRDSHAIITKRLKALVKKYGECFTDEQAIEATRKYVESFNGNYTYMQLLKYFIFKNLARNGEIEESSQLLSYIENKDEITLNAPEPNWDELEGAELK